jgi:ATP-dependent Clp protease ATP-binding subunit ClpC
MPPDVLIGSFLFLGPTGTGKTRIVEATAECLVRNPRAVIKIDCGEFQHSHEIAKLVGSPPGYLGHRETHPLLSQEVLNQYHTDRCKVSFVLFDEIEKAHPEVFNILLQVLDNGRLTDAKGRTVNFKNTIIIMTSNIGAEHIDKMSSLGFGSGLNVTEGDKYEKVKEKVTDSLKEYFRPEFLNRLDDIVLFNILSPESIRSIVQMQVDIVAKRLEEKHITLTVSDAALDYLGREGYSSQYGARPLKRLIQAKILTAIANMMVSRGVMEGGHVKVDIKDNEFSFDVRKGPERATRSASSRAAARA